MSEETVLFTQVPECDDLCCIDCKITSLEVTDEFTPSLFHCQILICRSILASFREVIAAPVPRTDNYIYVIAKKGYFQTSDIQEFLRNKKLWLSDPQPVIFEIYKECVKYTMMFRLAPLWNKFGQYFCQGKNFLTFAQDPNAVKFDINMKKQGMFLKFSSMKLKVCPLKVEELGLSPSLLAEFKQNPEGIIHLGRQWANVLPSMIKTRLLKVSKQIPKTFPFRNYQSLRRHWRNMYGYILPERSEGILYYEVCFRVAPEQFFVYPDICLQLETPKMIRSNNQSLICIQFVEGLRNEVHSICGKSLSFVKFDLKEFQETPPNSGFLPTKEIKRMSSQISRIPSIYGNVNPQPNFANGNFIPKLKQQTLNFPKFETATSLNLTSKPLKNSNSAKTSQNRNENDSKIKSPDVSTGILSQYTQSIPLQRKLIVDPKVENDNISVKSETFKSLLNLIKFNENEVRQENEKKRGLVNALLQEKTDMNLLKTLSPPRKRVRISKTNPIPPLETVAKYFKVQKSNSDKPVKNEGNKLKFENLMRNK